MRSNEYRFRLVQAISERDQDFPASGRYLARMTSETRTALLSIVTGGLIAGVLDLMQAMILFGRKVPLAIAAGLLGRSAFHGGPATYALGVALHFFIALSIATFYYAGARHLRFPIDHPLVCGLFFGTAVDTVMNLVVLPLSALHSRGPYRLSDLILGQVVHGIVIGLPIAYCVRWFAKRSALTND